ncbi:tricyclene synthase EBOS [Pyrus ussuriensis x Pyrus communis]|uniref:Tricyclene synthase EBOS n=1 Tax=Pyrus ussuriensis x Pyrus communis TaxID=2448454 RepID=A0A5N5I2Z8_9ROSA|nr:tricyclene synthase EBOS [Pyrus ussuriensis x Pyrus communis]KAB2634555.1 tricyclene synthase EBOS [Pyrus ussuriensis x Pyrus communis]
MSHIAPRTRAYKPSIWNYDFIQSLKIDDNTLQDKVYKDELKFVEEKVKHMIDYEDDDINILTTLEFIDDIQGLGLGYHFEEGITRALDKLLNNIHGQGTNQSLHLTALSFRLLRQHGFEVSNDVFGRFTGGNGSLKAWICKDIKGLLSMYEASYFAFEGKNLLDESLAFSIIYLKNHSGANATKGLAEQVSDALELPLHHRMQRLEARRYIEAYSKKPDANQVLLEIAKRDFNRVQCNAHSKGIFKKYQGNKFVPLIYAIFGKRESNKELGVVDKSGCSSNTIDDVYDVYGTLDELELFTSAVERWDIKAIQILPGYMKLCFLALYNTVNEMVYDTLKEQGEYVLPYVIKLNKDAASASPFTKEFVKAAINLARISQCIYQYGDGHGAPDTRAKNGILSVITDPI